MFPGWWEEEEEEGGEVEIEIPPDDDTGTGTGCNTGTGAGAWQWQCAMHRGKIDPETNLHCGRWQGRPKVRGNEGRGSGQLGFCVL